MKGMAVSTATEKKVLDWEKRTSRWGRPTEKAQHQKKKKS